MADCEGGRAGKRENGIDLSIVSGIPAAGRPRRSRDVHFVSKSNFPQSTVRFSAQRPNTVPQGTPEGLEAFIR